MFDLLDRRIHDEGAAQHEDDGREVDPAFDDPWHVQHEERLFERCDELDHQEQKHDAQAHGDQDAVASDAGLVLLGRALTLDRDVEQVVEAQHRLQEDQHSQVEEILDREEIQHRTLRNRAIRVRAVLGEGRMHHQAWGVGSGAFHAPALHERGAQGIQTPQCLMHAAP